MSAGQLRILKSRIKSVDNTKKITRAMEMVSAAKLRRFQNMMTEAMPYTADLEKMLGRLVQDQAEQTDNQKKSSEYSHPFFEEREEKRIALVLITSDSGLCGPYNMELIDLAKNFMGERGNISALIGIGKMGISSLKKEGRSFRKTFIEIRANQVEATIKELNSELQSIYLNGEADAVYVIYNHFISATKSKSVAEKVLPFKQPEQSSDASNNSTSYIYEPSPELIFEKLIPTYFEAKIRMLFLESYVSEHMARMNAMHQATKNAREMIDSLVLVRNKVRQAIITKEIIEIISGSQAQKN